MPYKNKEVRYAAQGKHRDRNFEQLKVLLNDSQCVDCGKDDWRVLEFDHLPGSVKKFNIARAVAGSTRSWNTIKKEIDKCDIVCANCHRIRTGMRGDFKRFRD